MCDRVSVRYRASRGPLGPGPLDDGKPHDMGRHTDRRAGDGRGPALRRFALSLACAVGVWILAQDRDGAAAPSDQVLSGDDDRDRPHPQLESPGVELVAAIDEQQAGRVPVSVESPVADESDHLDPVDPAEPDAAPADDRVHPVYTFWDDSGGPPMLDDELTLTLVERADGGAFKPWSNSVELSAVRDMQPKFTVALPLPAPGLYRATCRDGRYKPTDVWVPDIDHPQVAIVLEPADSAGSGR
jgi:hypothetical protein